MSPTASPVTSIGERGFWLLVEDREYFVPFADYPVFAKATVEQIFAVEAHGSHQFHWPALDADIELDALKEPDRFPLLYK